MKINQDKFQKMTEPEPSAVDIEITFSEPTTKDYQLVLLSKDELEEKLKIDPEKFEKMTEFQREWELFRRAELKEKLEKWIEIKIKLDKKKN